MEPSIAEIPSLRKLGLLPGLPDWNVARRLWTTSEGKQYQFIAAHPNHWSYEYRCTEERVWLGSYWCTYPQCPVLQAVVEHTILWLIYEEWDWMSSDGISP